MCREAANRTAQSILSFYERARIPALAPNKVAEEIMAFYIKFKDLFKIPISERGKPGTPLERIQEFNIKMPETMKFWPRDAMDKIENEEDKQFLLSIQNDRKASMSGVDKVLHQKEMRKEKKEQEALRRAEKERQCKDNEKTCTQVTETER